jgi:tetratricopeptide (TPR) repeat protein
MKINGAEEGRKEATIAAGANQEITFSVTKNEAGIYNVVVGESISSFTVEAKTIYDQWFYIIAAIVALSTGIAVFLIVRRWFYRRAVAPSFGNIPASREYVLAYNQGLEHYGRGEYDTAIQEYSKAVNVDPKQISAYVNRGITYFVKGEHEKAIADFTQAIALDPNYVIAFYNRGLVYKTTGQEVEAISDFENVIRLGTNRNLSKKAKKLTDELLQTKK